MPSGDIPDDLATAIYEKVSANDSWDLQNVKHYYLMPIDADNNGRLDYLFVKEMQHGTFIDLYFLENAKWSTVAFKHSENIQDFKAAFFDAVKSGKFEVVNPKWQDVIIGGQTLHADD